MREPSIDNKGKSPSMLTNFRLHIISGLAVLLIAGSLSVAVADGTGTVDPPPTFAFVATAYNYADALAVGPVAGRLGAPLFTTGPDSLDPHAEEGLSNFDPDIVVIAGGVAAISEQVENDIQARGYTVRRAAGAGRTETAKRVADIIKEYNPAFLPVDATATDADLLDGLDSTAFIKQGEASLVEAVPATGPSSARPGSRPTNLIPDHPEVTFTTNVAGVLHMTLRSPSSVLCDEPVQVWAWVELDGSPIDSSLTPAYSGMVNTITAVSDGPVAAGTHTMTVGAGCESGSGEGGTAGYANGTVAVID